MNTNEQGELDLRKFKIEVQADTSGTWAGNMLEFTNISEAKEYAIDLMFRWTMVLEWRVVDFNGNVVATSVRESA